jgi:hypothetical protein
MTPQSQDRSNMLSAELEDHLKRIEKLEKDLKTQTLILQGLIRKTGFNPTGYHVEGDY